MNKTLSIVLLIIVVAFLGWLFLRNTGNTVTVNEGGQTVVTPTTNGNTGDTTTPAVNAVRIALLDPEGTTTGKQRGCDRVVMVERPVASTGAPLTAAMKELFSIGTTSVNGWYNFMAKTNSTLSFDRATVENGTANIYLKGQLSGLAGVCDDPRAQIQIEETALQFPTVKNVAIYLNGTKTTLTPNESGM